MEPSVGGSGVAGGGLLAHEPDDAPDRTAVRGVALRGTSSDRLTGIVAGPGPGPGTGPAPTQRPDRHPRRHPGAAARSPTGRPVEELPLLGEPTRSLSTPTPAWSSPWAGQNQATAGDCTAYRDSGINRALAGRAVMA